jgi:hypothetical protein
MNLLTYLSVIVATATLFTTNVSFANSDNRISIETESQGSLIATQNIEFSFKLYDQDTKKSVEDSDLEESHTKKLHLVVYDSSLNEFNHVHPTFDGQVWKSELNLTTNGSYFVWAQGVLLEGAEFSAAYRVNVVGGKPELPVMVLGNIRNAALGNTVIDLSKQKIRAGKMATLTYTISRNDGTQPDVTQYLGANAHVIAVSPDGADLIHAHPMDGNNSNTGMIHVSFPTAGDFRIWVQVIDAGILKTVPLSVTVQK